MPQAVCQGPVTHMTCGMWPVTYIACIVCRNHSADNSCSMSHIGGHALSAGCVGFVRHYCKRRVCACACAFVRMCVSIYLSIYLSIFLSLCLSVFSCFFICGVDCGKQRGRQDVQVGQRIELSEQGKAYDKRFWGMLSKGSQGTVTQVNLDQDVCWILWDSTKQVCVCMCDRACVCVCVWLCKCGSV